MLPLRHAIVLTATALGLGIGFPGTGWAAIGSHEAEYLGGTVKTLEAKTAGTLDLKDASDLQFRYTVDKFRLPYASIRSFTFSAPAHRHLVGHVPVPKVPFRKHDQILDISFREEGGALGNASFRVSGAARASLEDRLKERVETERRTGSSASRTKLPEAWWGDRYWKTTRNKTGWSDQPVETAPAAAGTK